MKRALAALLFLVAAAASGTTPSYYSGSATSTNFDHVTTPFQVTISSYVVPSLTNGVMIVAISDYAETHSITSVTWNGSSLTHLDVSLPYTFNTSETLDLYYIKAPTATTANVVVTWNGQTGTGVVGVILYENVDQTTPFGTIATTNSTGTTSSVNVSTASGDLAFAAFSNDDNYRYTPSGSSVERLDVSQASGIPLATYELAAVGATTTPTATMTSTIWGAVGVALKQSGGGPTNTPTATNTRNRIHIGNLERTPLPVQFVSTRWKD